MTPHPHRQYCGQCEANNRIETWLCIACVVGIVFVTPIRAIALAIALLAFVFSTNNREEHLRKTGEPPTGSA